MEFNFNRRTADYCTLPTSDVVWVQTLNEAQTSRVGREANRETAERLLSYQKGRSSYNAVMKDISTFDEDALIAQITSHRANQREYTYPAIEAAPYPTEPERGDETEQAFVEEYALYKDACDRIDAQRLEHSRELMANDAKRLSSFNKTALRAELFNCIFRNIFIAELMERRKYWTILLSCRNKDNHKEQIFESVEDIEDADDGIADALIEFYDKIDSVEVEAIPTQADKQ